ncbi:hypothetical protein AUR64_09200 [Haloprofundus marisrubri]|uniref:DUF7319 domain-containing protein n=1 Tax=Haloprofundus marisrubri TaxID=1514971 RepID=A0A0W1R8Y6_9EURY|nr:hypothetical protein [Haloprofundus marisrubri]KTG09799.1 hypothetical protein AUR64_09200 [Haloprofundus marisrubri]
MSDPSSASADGPDEPSDRQADSGTDADELDALRREVESKYDFDNFGPREMAEMSLEEWEVAFDSDSWITGPELLDRVEKELRSRVASREVFAVIERVREDGEDRVVAYSDEGFAIVYDDGTVEGQGTVLRDVKPTVALCSMDDYEVEEPPRDASLPKPDDVPEGTGQLGNNMLQVVAGVQIVAALGLLVLWSPLTSLIPFASAGQVNFAPPAVAFFFLLIGLFLFMTVANARLSDRFRAEEYRNRLRALDPDSTERPEFLPGGEGSSRPAVDAEESAESRPTTASERE